MAEKAQDISNLEFDIIQQQEKIEYFEEQEQFAGDYRGYLAGGGIVGIRRPSAIPLKKDLNHKAWIILDIMVHNAREK